MSDHFCSEGFPVQRRWLRWWLRQQRRQQRQHQQRQRRRCGAVRCGALAEEQDRQRRDLPLDAPARTVPYADSRIFIGLPVPDGIRFMYDRLF